MPKLLTLAFFSLTSLTALTACGMPTAPVAPAQDVSAKNAQVTSVSKNTKPSTDAIKPGDKSDIRIDGSKGQAKPITPFELNLRPPSRDLSTTEVIKIARSGLDFMERSSSYESGYQAGRLTLDTLARHNAYIARLAIAATNPEMTYESAYKTTAKALAFIANNHEISIPSVCDLVRDMMNVSKSYEDGTRIGYGTMGFIRQTASLSIRAVIDSSIRSAQAARYWEDAYHTLYSAYGSIRHMN